MKLEGTLRIHIDGLRFRVGIARRELTADFSSLTDLVRFWLRALGQRSSWLKALPGEGWQAVLQVRGRALLRIVPGESSLLSQLLGVAPQLALQPVWTRQRTAWRR